MKKKIRVGLFIDEYYIPLWAYEMIKLIQESNHSEIKLVVVKKTQVKKTRSFIEKAWINRDILLFFLYIKFENVFFNYGPNAFELKNLKNIINCPEIEVKPKETKLSDYILKEDIDKIEKYNIDVFIKLGFKILNEDILKTAKYGVWSYYHGDKKAIKGESFGVWEVLKQISETSVKLQILTENFGGGLKTYESFSSTDKVSIKRNVNNSYWKAKNIIPRKLEELYKLGEGHFFMRNKKWYKELVLNSIRPFEPPKTIELFKGLVINFRRYIIKKINRVFFFEQWILLFYFEKEQGISESFERFVRIFPPKDRDWADPFVIYKNNKYYIFIEELIYTENKGKISVFEMDKNGNYTKPVVVLEKDYHLSYPFIFEECGEIYMIPETSHNNSIDLYKCVKFPTKWKLIKVLNDNILASDSTLLKYNEKYWLFTNYREQKGVSNNDELFLFYSDNLLEGEWNSHPQNPIVSDVKCARPAGKIFVFKDKFYRPGQNCSNHYGYGMQISEIVVLNEHVYEENHVQSINPNWNKDIKSTHTLNFSGGLTIIDARVKRKK